MDMGFIGLTWKVGLFFNHELIAHFAIYIVRSIHKTVSSNLDIEDLVG